MGPTFWETGRVGYFSHFPGMCNRGALGFLSTVGSQSSSCTVLVNLIKVLKVGIQKCVFDVVDINVHFMMKMKK